MSLIIFYSKPNPYVPNAGKFLLCPWLSLFRRNNVFQHTRTPWFCHLHFSSKSLRCQLLGTLYTRLALRQWIANGREVQHSEFFLMASFQGLLGFNPTGYQEFGEMEAAFHVTRTPMVHQQCPSSWHQSVPPPGVSCGFVFFSHIILNTLLFIF